MSKPDEYSHPRPFWRQWLWPLCLLALVITIFALGSAGLLTGLEGLIEQIAALATSPWGLPALIGLFCLGAYLGVPQFVLVGAGVAVFGPALGFTYSWLATLCSGALTFWTGRALGAGVVQRRAGGRLVQMTDLIKENTFIASAIVRTIPTGPFLIVNMLFGVSGARFLPFWLGLGCGSVPKLALIAFAGEGLIAALTGSLWRAVLFGLIAASLWLVIGITAKQILARSR